jgi:hypothetical protein
MGTEGEECFQCHWPIGETDCGGKPYGFDIAYLAQIGMFGSEVRRCKRIGSKGAVNSYARMKKGFLRVLSLRPYTREQWVRTYGEGRM